MEIVKEIRFRCDACNDEGSLSVRLREGARQDIVICADCAEQLAKLLSKQKTPKSPTNVILKSEQRKKQKERGLDEQD